jgi:hypothetical protein
MDIFIVHFDEPLAECIGNREGAQDDVLGRGRPTWVLRRND